MITVSRASSQHTGLGDLQLRFSKLSHGAIVDVPSPRALAPARSAARAANGNGPNRRVASHSDKEKSSLGGALLVATFFREGQGGLACLVSSSTPSGEALLYRC